MLINQPSAKPTRKVAATGISGACVTLLLWGAKQAGVDLNVETATALVLVVSFGAGYFFRERV